MLLVGLGIRMHADSKYTNKMWYHTPESLSYKFDDVFAELKIGDNVMFLSILVGSVGGIWFTFVAVSRDRRRRSNQSMERTADRRENSFPMIKNADCRTKAALVSGRSSYSR